MAKKMEKLNLSAHTVMNLNFSIRMTLWMDLQRIKVLTEDLKMFFTKTEKNMELALKLEKMETVRKKSGNMVFQ